jgi:hypothetical protein
MRFVPLVLLCFLAACNQQPRQNEPAANALKALHKLQAATQVGVSYEQYGTLVIEAKAQVNEANRSLPTSDLQQQINQAMDAYTDAGQVWSEKLKGHQSFAGYTEPGISWKKKYSLPNDDVNAAMQAMWNAADDHVRIAEGLMQ